jgi:biotin carboxyl carrier protein
MKMKMELKASRAGVVEAVHGAPHRDVSQGENLITIRAE